jgi:AcrR family transcriptional regulator
MPSIAAVPAAQESAPRRRRADAERNRGRVLGAARVLFAARGADEVSMDEVARLAEVGIGTLYRHFPTKEALVEAAGQHRFGEILTYYRKVCREGTEPLEALTMLLTHIGEVESRDWGFASIAEGKLGSEGPPSEMRADLEAELVELVERGQRVGSIREDVLGTDVLSIACGLAAIAHQRSGDWRRFIKITLDGLRAS